ncbi:hypothetical protein CDD82_4002 [Ophiocordyceps australis]|uniref:SET domain-containing protein n=1 Tax=Ophiocordyceps australis TaxID=1399860 RepID=A0A2C5Z974_9HYPO|nr:hypothetical protein CDD82_4002 [Ophiocordyceps australis]
MEPVDALVKWATARGVELNGIQPKLLAGRGLGIVATRPLKPGDTVLSVPAALLRSLGNTPKPVVRRLDGASVHAILAAALCLDDSPDFDLWRAVLPSPATVRAAMPLCWPRELQLLLPPAAKALLDSQCAKLDRDWALVAAAYSDSRIPRLDFVYAWALVNSRTFYHTTPRTLARLPHDDHMVLQPVADLFNHTPHAAAGCSVAFDSRGYTFTAACAYKPGQELLIRYGAHSNDHLLVEYGFTLDSHPEDAILLDPYLCPVFIAPQRHLLRQSHFWQRYILGSDEPCYRTLTALRLLCLSTTQWRAVLDGSRDEDHDRDAVHAQLLKLLFQLQKDVRSKLAQLHRIKAGTPAMRTSLRTRWLQIKNLIMAHVSRLEA